MGSKYDIELTGVDVVKDALAGMQPELRKQTLPVLDEYASKIAEQAMGTAQPHPSGLWDAGGGRSLSPRYRVVKRGTFLIGVQTPGGAVGATEAISEFAHGGITPQGAALVRALSWTYGRAGGSGGGRILWQAADALSDALEADFKAAAEAAADAVDGRM